MLQLDGGGAWPQHWAEDYGINLLVLLFLD